MNTFCENAPKSIRLYMETFCAKLGNLGSARARYFPFLFAFLSDQVRAEIRDQGSGVSHPRQTPLIRRKDLSLFHAKGCSRQLRTIRYLLIPRSRLFGTDQSSTSELAIWLKQKQAEN
jgi:hypothetical protein